MTERKIYGWELILDLHECKIRGDVTNVLRFFEHACAMLQMKPYKVYFWTADELPSEGIPDVVHGMSAVQFILSSSITVHTSDDYGMILLNFHSCKMFDPQSAINFAADWFEAGFVEHHFMERGVVGGKENISPGFKITVGGSHQ